MDWVSLRTLVSKRYYIMLVNRQQAIFAGAGLQKESWVSRAS